MATSPGKALQGHPAPAVELAWESCGMTQRLHWLSEALRYVMLLWALFQVLVTFLLHSCSHGHLSQPALKPVFTLTLTWPTEVYAAPR